jgi:hypothetical protein
MLLLCFLSSLSLNGNIKCVLWFLLGFTDHLQTDLRTITISPDTHSHCGIIASVKSALFSFFFFSISIVFTLCVGSKNQKGNAEKAS